MARKPAKDRWHVCYARRGGAFDVTPVSVTLRGCDRYALHGDLLSVLVSRDDFGVELQKPRRQV